MIDLLGGIDESGFQTPIAIQGPIISNFPTKTIPVVQAPILTLPNLEPTQDDSGSMTVAPVVLGGLAGPVLSGGPILSSGALAIVSQDDTYSADSTVGVTMQPGVTISSPMAGPVASTPVAGQSFGVIGWGLLAFGAYWLFK